MSTSNLRVAFNGCSLTFGDGFRADQRDEHIYDRLVSRHFNFERTNLAINGSSNHTIFMRSADALKSKKHDILFVQWSALNRVWLSPGPECYLYVNDKKHPDFKYRNLYVSPKELKNFRSLLLVLNHDYQNILDLIDYCSFLDLIAKQTKTKLVYVNGLVPWQNDLSQPLLADLSTSLSEYSKLMLDFDNRNDEEIINLFSKLQKKFQDIDQNKWVNLFDSFQSNIVDVGPLGHHPGILSHQWMANKIIDYINERDLL